jgi:hypothetical protein
MNVPVFGKTVTFANLPSIAVTICAIMPFYEGGINRVAYSRGFYSSLNLGFAAKYCSQINFYYPAFLACFVNSGIFQTLCWNAARTFRAARFARKRRCNFLAVRFQNGLFVRSILIRGNQIHNTTTGSFLKILDKFCNVSFGTLARYNTYYQTMLWIISYMIPIVSLSTVIRNVVITMFSFLTHKGPFLIKLHLIGSRGKTQPNCREASLRVRRQQGYTVLPCPDVHLPDGLSYAPHNLLRGVLTGISFSSQIDAVQTTVYPFVQKICSCMSYSIAGGCGYFCHTSRILRDYLRCVFHNLGIFYSGNRILKEPALSCLPNLTVYGTTTCSLFRISARQLKFIQH